MDDVITVSTDLGTLAAFDPATLQHRVRGKDSWWRQGSLAALPEVAEGTIAILPIGKEGTYRIALRLEDPEEEAQALITGAVEGLGLEVRSGELFFGVGERLPGDGRGERLSSIPGTGLVVPMEPGLYDVTVSVLRWRHLDEHYDEEGEIRETAPADFILQLTRREEDEDVVVPRPIPTLLEQLPRHEAKASTHVPGHLRRRPSAPERSSSGRGRRRSASDDDLPPPAPRVAAPADWAPFSLPHVRAAFREVLLADQHPQAPLGCELILMRPRDRTLLATDLSLEHLLKKVTRVREQTRVLEAKLNATDLSGEEKAELHVPITRLYQALDDLVELTCLDG